MQTPPDDTTLATEAADWIVQLTADDAATRTQAEAGFLRWKQQSPRHAAAAARMEQWLSHAQALRANGTASAGRQALQATFNHQQRRQRVKRCVAALALASVLVLPGWITWQAYPPAYLMADLRAGTGQWQTHELPDGTRLTLSGASAVDLQYDASQRMVTLIQGEILVEVAADATRPFLVQTRDGSARALGTRYVVRQSSSGTQVSVLESTVQVRAAGSDATATLHAGQRVHLAEGRLSAITAFDATSASLAWQQQRLFIDDQPLSDVLATLARHRRGHLQFDAEALRTIRVSAVLPLDDSERALQLLAASLPGLRVRQFTPYWVSVELPATP